MSVILTDGTLQVLLLIPPSSYPFFRYMRLLFKTREKGMHCYMQIENLLPERAKMHKDQTPKDK